MKIKEQRRLPQSTVNEIVGDVSELCANNVAILGEEVFKLLKSAGITTEVPGLRELFNPSSRYCQPFDGLNTTYLQMSFYRKHFKLVVSK